MTERSANGGKGLGVGVVGATGAVGEVPLGVLAQRQFPISELRALASARSAGSHVSFAGKQVEVAEAKDEAFDGLDVALFAATGSLSKTLAPEVVKRGAIAIDKSSTWRISDNLRKGAATNAVQIAELLIARGLL